MEQQYIYFRLKITYSVYIIAFRFVIANRIALSADPTSLYILHTLTSKGVSAKTKHRWKDHIRSIQIGSVAGPKLVKLDKFKRAQPNMNALVNLQSLIATSVFPRFVK